MSTIASAAALFLGALPAGEYYVPPPPPPQTEVTVEVDYELMAVPPPPLSPPRGLAGDPAGDDSAGGYTPIVVAGPEGTWEPPPVPTVEQQAEDAPRAPDGIPSFGAQLDAGVPDGIGASLVLRPWRALRLQAGGLTNTVAGGFRVGVTLAPFFAAFTPTLTVEGGLLGRGDLSPAIRWAAAQPLPEGTFAAGNYGFYSAQAGIEVGSPRRFVFYARAGLSRVDAVLQGTPQTLGSGAAAVTLSPGEMNMKLTMPSAKVGLTVYLFD